MKNFVLASLALALFGSGFVVARIDSNAALAQEQQYFFPLDKMREFSEVFQIIRNSYVDDISDEQLMENAIRGLVNGLDANSAYFNEEEMTAFSKSYRNEEFGGIGLYLGVKDGWVHVQTSVPNTPAGRAEIQAGDYITKIDGESTRGLPLDKAVLRIRGKIGDVLVLEIVSDGKQPRDVELRREKIVVSSAHSALIEKDYGYLRINQFQVGTPDDAIRQLNELYEKNDGPLSGLVLDLRRNPGGLLDASVEIASIFLPEGATVVINRSRDSEDASTARRADINLDNADEIRNLRLVVLVDNGSASASEIVAGAIQDHKRGVIMGVRTYGKASVQNVTALPSTERKTGLKLTTARYFTPLNRSIQAVGVVPDVVVEPGESIKNKGQQGLVSREENQPGHLKNTETETENDEALPKAKKLDDSSFFLPQNDHQFDQALLVLKALTIAE